MDEDIHCNLVCDRKQWKQRGGSYQILAPPWDSDWATVMLRWHAPSTAGEELMLLGQASKVQDSVHNLPCFLFKRMEDKNLYLYFFGFAKHGWIDLGKLFKEVTCRAHGWTGMRPGGTFLFSPFCTDCWKEDGITNSNLTKYILIPEGQGGFSCTTMGDRHVSNVIWQRVCTKP